MDAINQKPVPTTDPDSAPYWAALLEERLILKSCGECGRSHFYPRELCPHCHSANLTWIEASGRGEIYSFTICRRPAGPAFASDVPYVVALVDLAEGPRMMTRIVGDPFTVAIGQNVSVEFERHSADLVLPVFQGCGRAVTTIDRLESVRMIRDSVGAIASPPGDLRRIRALRGDPVGVERAVWQRLTELGWLALLLGEDSGGLGLGARELAAMGEELGAALIPEPVAAVAATVPLLDTNVRDRVLGGTMIVVPAWRETIVGSDEMPRTIVAGGTVTGRKILVPDAAAADAFVVTTASGAVMIERDAPGIAVELSRTQDGGQSGTLTMVQSPCVTLEGDVGAALQGLALAHCGYLLGAAERAFAMTLDYLAIRKQFGRLIGSFQVLQHRAAEAKIQLVLSRAVLDEAIGDVERQADPGDQLRSRSRALARVSDTAMLIAREAVQMHGAIGITDEHDIGLYCRKILSIYNQFGTASANRSRYLASLHPETAA